jgi:AcrR family transcriptional regulator
VTGDELDRERALGAARQVLSRVGIQGIKLESVLAASGLSTRAFYRQFADKHDLLRALIQEHYAVLTEQTRVVLRTAPDPIEGLRRWVEYMLDVDADPDRSRKEAGLGRHWQEVWLAYPDEVVGAVTGMHDDLTQVMRQIQKSGAAYVRPRTDAASVLLLTLSVIQQRLVGRPPVTLADARDIVWPFVRRSLTLQAQDTGGAAP